MKLSTKPDTTAPHKKVILFNGPPGVGKDTAVRTAITYLFTHAPYLNAKHMKFAEALKKATHALFGVDHWNWDHFDKPENAPYKDVPCGEFFGMSPREAYISMSEDYAKPKIDPLFFGWIARRKIGVSNSNCFLFSDSGFVDELDPIVRYVTPESMLLVELYAKDKSFKSDSRGYIGDEVKKRWPGITVRKITNEFGDAQDLELFRMYCKGAVKSFLDIEERK